MPEQLSINDFMKETWEDYNSPTTSSFVTKMAQCKNTISSLEETLDTDRSGLTKMKKSVKALYSSGNTHVTNEALVAANLEKLGKNASNRENEGEIGAAFLKFAVVTKDLSLLMKNLMANIQNILMFPMDTILKGDLRGVKGDIKKPFDKASKEYDAKFNKIEKEKKRLAIEAGMIKTEVTGAEIAEELEKERRMFQLQACEYMIKANEIKTKKGVDLLQHLVEYYHGQMNYFTDGMKTIEHFRCYIEELVHELGRIKQRQEQERRKLLELRDALKTSMSAYNRESVAAPSGYSLHQLAGNKAHGCVKSGYLLKKSDGKMRKVWQRRRCVIQDGLLSISHSDISKPPVKLNLLTCQVKLIQDDPGKKCFDLISSSKSRTYHFQGEDQAEMEQWISVLNNAKEAVFMKEVGDSRNKDGDGGERAMNQNVKELTHTILQEVRRLPGNNICCDCGAPEPEWLSVNLGVLICLECCGVHREMGVHISRTQSIVIDDLGTSQLLMARVTSNQGFNDIMEATLEPQLKPTPTSDMGIKKQFIRSKYERKKFTIVTTNSEEDRKQEVKMALHQHDIYGLLQMWAEGVDFTEPLPDMEGGETSLHLAVELNDDCSSLYMVDFIVQNSNSQFLCRGNNAGDTALHVCAALNATESMKLLLRVQPDLLGVVNKTGRTALDIAHMHQHHTCVELLNHCLAGKNELFNNVNIDWELINDDHLYDDLDYSDDDLDRCHTPDRKSRSRPGSLVLSSESTLPLPGHNRERSLTGDSLKFSTLGPPPPPHKLKGLSREGGGTLQRKKAPAPPPPNPTGPGGHTRNPSDPGMTALQKIHSRSPSDPNATVAATSIQENKTTKTLPGAKLVLPPAPAPDGSLKPVPAPRPKSSRGRQPQPSQQQDRGTGDSDGLLMSSTVRMNGSNKSPVDSLGRSVESLDSVADPPTTNHARRRRRSSSSSRRKQQQAASSTGSSTGSLDDNLGGTRQTPSSTGESPSPSSLPKDLPPPPHSSLPAPVPLPVMARCKALYDCEADNEDELSFKEGDVLLLVSKEEDEWWHGFIAGHPNKQGMFPATFVDMLPD